MEKNPDFVEIGKRLRALRERLATLNQAQLAASLGVQPTRLNNWETGVRRIPLECAEKLVDTYGLSLDWIYRGRVDGLSENARKVLSSHLAM